MQTGKVKVSDRQYKVVIATSISERSQGLKHIKEMPSDIGMLFIHNVEGRHPYWMAETHIPLTMIYANKNKEVVDVIHRHDTNNLVQSKPAKPAKYVLEVKLDESLDNLIGEKILIGGSNE